MVSIEPTIGAGEFREVGDPDPLEIHRLRTIRLRVDLLLESLSGGSPDIVLGNERRRLDEAYAAWMQMGHRRRWDMDP